MCARHCKQDAMKHVFPRFVRPFNPLGSSNIFTGLASLLLVTTTAAPPRLFTTCSVDDDDPDPAGCGTIPAAIAARDGLNRSPCPPPDLDPGSPDDDDPDDLGGVLGACTGEAEAARARDNPPLPPPNPPITPAVDRLEPYGAAAAAGGLPSTSPGLPTSPTSARRRSSADEPLLAVPLEFIVL